MSDTHHFKETVNGGILGINAGNRTGSGVWVFQLSDFPIFQRFNQCFEFARLNKITIEYWPKFNMQLNQNVAGTINQSISGTLITALDQIPFNVIVGTTGAAPNWVADGSDTSGTSSATPYESPSITPGYARGIQNSREKELYVKRTQTFDPAFYDYVVSGDGIGNISGAAAFERKIKKWVTTSYQTTTGTGLVTSGGNGPLYYGPIYCFDVNAGYPASATVELYDIKLKYSMSFRRLKGV